MRILCAILVGALATAGAFASELVFDTKFGEATKGLTARSGFKGPRGDLSGKMAEGWYEDSSGWCDVSVVCSPMAEEGAKYLRFEIKSILSGVAQFCHPLGMIPCKTYYRLSMRYRNCTNADMLAVMRLQPPPYTLLASRTPPKSTDWTTQVFEFAVEKTAEPVGVWLNFRSPGIVDVAEIKLESMSEAEMSESCRRAYPDGGPANLFRNPVLPMGIQQGWMLRREVSDDDVTLSPDSEVVGPSGCPALKVCSGTESDIKLVTEPFKPVFFVERHAFSVRCKGQKGGRLSLVVSADGQDLVRRHFGISKDGWQVYSAEFSPGPFSEMHVAEILANGEMWIDACEVCPVSKTGKFVIPGKCVVGLGVPASDAALAKVQFDDEPAKISYKVFGDSEGSVLKAVISDVYGESKPLPCDSGCWSAIKAFFDSRDDGMPLEGAGKMKEGCLDFSHLLKDKPYGAFRIEAWVERGGETISPKNEIVVYRLRRPKFWGKDAPDSPFGVHVESALRHVLMAKSVGINWVRLHDPGLNYIGWSTLEPEKGKWQFFDRRLQRYRDQRLMLLGELGTAPKWASYYADSGRKAFEYHDKFFQPKKLSDYENYVETVASKYKGVIDSWDVWNEPWIAEWWPVSFDHAKGGRGGYVTSKEPQKDFVSLMKSACTKAKEMNPHAFVLGFNTCSDRNVASLNRISGTLWTKGVLDNGGMAFCDGICYHEYECMPSPGNPKDSIKRGLENAISPILEKYGKCDKPIWMTEGSSSPDDGAIGYGLYKNVLPFKNEDDYWAASDKLSKFMLSLASSGVSKWFLYSMHAYTFYKNRRFAVLVAPDGALHPSGAAFSAFAYFTEGKKCVGVAPIADEAWAFTFGGKEEAVVVVSGNTRAAPLPIRPPEGAKLFDLFGNPVMDAVNFDGKIFYLRFPSLELAEKGVGSLAATQSQGKP